MNRNLLAIVAIPLTVSVAVPLHAQDFRPARSPAPTTAQAQLTSEQLAAACTQNRAETLPRVFTDLPPNHWAFKAVMTLHYCGAFRQAAPPSLFQLLPRSEPLRPRS